MLQVNRNTTLQTGADCANVHVTEVSLQRQVQACCVGFVVMFGYSAGFGQKPNEPVVIKTPKTPKKPQKVNVKPLKPLSQKDIQRANKKGLEASSGKSIQKTNEKILKDQAKAMRKANKKAAKANKALLKAHAKAVRNAQREPQTKDQ
jgi:hypothetical protein